MYILAIVLIVLILLLFLPIRLGVKYCDDVDIYIKIGPVKKRLNLQSDKKVKAKKSVQSEDESAPVPLKKLLYYKDLFLYIKDDVLKIAEFLFKKGILIEDLNFRLDYGWDDAASVGMLYGIINAVAYSIMGFIHNNMTVKRWKIDINPDYENEVFSGEIDCIFKTRLVYISIIGIKGLKVLFKIKNKDYRRKKI